jgi:hypothetical protein
LTLLLFGSFIIWLFYYLTHYNNWLFVVTISSRAKLAVVTIRI